MLGRDGFMKEVGLRDGIVYSRTVFDSSSFDIGPQAAVTTCEGWGWQCCSPLTQAGVGEVQKQVLDCRENCYTACVDRPILSLFNTEPFMDTNSRVVRLPRTEQRVKFAYRVISLSVPLQMVRVHTGDGRVYERFDETGVVEHRYACTGTCVYDAYVEATDESELGLGESRLRRIRVVVE